MKGIQFFPGETPAPQPVEKQKPQGLDFMGAAAAAAGGVIVKQLATAGNLSPKAAPVAKPPAPQNAPVTRFERIMKERGLM